MDRSEICRKAVNERWHPTIPKATHSGILILGGQEIECYNLADGRRVLRKTAVYKALGRSRPSGQDIRRANEQKLPVFMAQNNLTPYLEKENLQAIDLIIFKTSTGIKIEGYDASLLPEVCRIYLNAESEGKLLDSQKHIAKVCKSILYGLSKIGIISLVDEATGFVEQRNRDELENLLKKYISEELRPWTKKFPNEFFKQVYRLHGWQYPNILKNHPQYVGKIIEKYVYKRLPPGILEILKNKNPQNENGNRKFRYHQFLSDDIGEVNLQRQIQQVITLMRVSRNIDEFNELMNRTEFLNTSHEEK